ncbi:MAG: ABC transporter, partial [Alistipes sp.]|nr:ABC transporter [Alistipes sp.]
MNLINLFRKIGPYVRPYRWLVVLTLILTLIGSFIAQINAVVLDRTVDAINNLINTDSMVWSRAAHILTIITLVLLGKEVLSAAITYAQHFFGEKMRINVSKDLSQAVIDQMLRYRMAFFSRANNETGKLQTRIDQGVSSLSSTVQNFFIDLLPLFMSAVLALILMFAANVYVGLAALGIVPIY